MAFLRTLHSGFSNAIVWYSLALGLWALWSAWRREGLSGSYWGALVLGEGLMIAQGVVGVLLWLQGTGPGQWVHILYGVLAVIVWPGAYAFMYRRDAPQLDPRRQAVLLGLIGLFLAGVGLRAMTTAFPK